MAGLSIPLLLSYAAFDTLLFYQVEHLRHFHGSSEAFEVVLGWWAFLGLAFDCGFLLYFWHITTFWSALKLGIMGAVLSMPVAMVVAVASRRWPLRWLLSLTGLPALPICGYIMVRSLP